jgi:hypothetical protein
MIETNIYDQKFYENRSVIFDSARVIIPHVLKFLNVKSVIDIGCGPAEWLSVFREKGISDVRGFDGEWVDKLKLHIPQESFVTTDLKKPLQVDRKFDLAISLEVAEHLPEPVAKQLVSSITSSAPAVLFSAAIPLQGGSYHVNEQWPIYWASLFRTHGFVAVDCIRNKIWNNNEVGWWYCQNCILFIKMELLEKSAELKMEYEKTNGEVLSLVHPRLFTYYAQRHNKLISLIPGPLKWVYRKFIKK